MRAGGVILMLLLASVPAAVEAQKRQGKVDPAVQAMAVCAAEKNAGDVAWAYMVQSGQSGLAARSLDGASAQALFLMARDCAPGRTSFDNKGAIAFSNAAFAAWGGDLRKPSQARPIDGWADCLVEHEPARGRGYLFARDAGFAGGPTFVVDGVNPIEAIFQPIEPCDAARPAERASINLTDLYARLNYRLRVQSRLAAAPASATSEKN